MDNRKPDKTYEKVDVNFESHPPIEEDLEGIAALLKQTLLHFCDCSSIAHHLIQLKDVTQIIALEAPDEENTNEDDEPDNDIYGVSSVVDVAACKSGDELSKDGLKQLLGFLKGKCTELSSLLDSKDNVKIGFVINERYINLPPQLALPTFKNLTTYLKDSQFTHLVFIAKLLIKSRSTDTQLPSKKSRSGESSSNAEPLIYMNPEEEIIFEHSEFHADIDVSSYCDENATWFAGSDIKYIPHRRIMVMDYSKWDTALANLEKELN